MIDFHRMLEFRSPRPAEIARIDSGGLAERPQPKPKRSQFLDIFQARPKNKIA